MLERFDLEKQAMPVVEMASTPIALLVRGDPPGWRAMELRARAR